jgi:uncharacterized repeat protein (TIGR02543 family)
MKLLKIACALVLIAGLAACQNLLGPAAKVTTYMVTYDGNGNSGGTAPSDGSTYPAGGSITVLANSGTLAKTGYTFSGWNSKADGSGTSYAPGVTFAMGTAAVTLYAVWAQDQTQDPTYTVSYSANTTGSTGSAPVDSTTYLQGATATVLGNTGTLAKTGYTFSGWNSKADGSGSSYAPGVTFAMGTAAVTLYAVWAQDLGATGTSSATVSDIPQITLTLSGQSASLAKGSNMTVTATPSASVESYAWYLDGALLAGQSASSYSVGTSLTTGTHSLMSVVKKSGSLFSTTIYFVVK